MNPFKPPSGGFSFVRTEMHLTFSDIRSVAWRNYVRDLEERLQELRAQNDQEHADGIKTAAIRGRIAEVKRTLALSQELSASAATNPDEFGVGAAG